MDFHVKFKGITGNRKDASKPERLDKIHRFHRIVKQLDSDWPFVVNTDERGAYWTMRECEICKGRIYRLPNLSPQDLKALGKQLGLHVKIKQFLPETKCTPVGGVPRWRALPLPPGVRT